MDNVSASQHLLLHPHSSKKQRPSHSMLSVSRASCWERGGVPGGKQPLQLMLSVPREGAPVPVEHPCWSAALCRTAVLPSPFAPGQNNHR